MPNEKNVMRPISLIGLGRSGTTLVTSIFKRHPEVQAIGETANFVYSSYYHVLKALPVCGERKMHETLEEASARSVHAMLTRTFPSDRPFWFHKPIRVPLVARMFGMAPECFPEFIEFYWDASVSLFPKGRFFTVLRDPVEVLISSMTRWQMTPKAAIGMLRSNYELMLSDKSRVGLYLAFEDLTVDKEQTVRRMLDFAGLDFHPACLKAFEGKHAVNPPRDENLVCPEIPDYVLDLYQNLRKRITQ